MNVVCCLTAAAALFATSIGHAQSGDPGASQPVFRASVELIQLDVSVTDKHGVVVPGLGASDFLLKQDGTAIPVQHDDLQYLADRTGGIAGRSNAIDLVLSRVAADQRGYYLLAYEPPASTFKKGRLQYRDVKVSVTNPDLQVRSRAGFYGVPDAALARR